MTFCFVLVALFQRQIEGGAQLSLMLQAWPYLILTIAEVLVSTTGLEFAYTQAAASMKSSIMGFFFLTTALGNLLIVTNEWHHPRLKAMMKHAPKLEMWQKISWERVDAEQVMLDSKNPEIFTIFRGFRRCLWPFAALRCLP